MINHPRFPEGPKSKELIDEFVSHVYGPAAGKVRELITLQRTALVNSGEHLHVFQGPAEKKFLSDDLLQRSDALLAEAAAIAKSKGDPALIRRINILRMPVWYTRFSVARESPAVRKEQAQRMLEYGKSLSYTHVDAWSASYPPFATQLQAFVSSVK
jgi:hypothetical protein